MKVTVEPTEETTRQKIDERWVELRVWKGETDRGTRVIMLVDTICAEARGDTPYLEAQIPGFMVPTRRIVGCRRPKK